MTEEAVSANSAVRFLPEFSLAQRLRPDVFVLFNLGSCQALNKPMPK
jgi:hypothetical protein